jgi:hypothetical protein
MVQDVPAFVETYSNPSAVGAGGQQVAATILLPSAEQAKDSQLDSGALVWIQLWASPRNREVLRTSASKRLEGMDALIA